MLSARVQTGVLTLLASLALAAPAAQASPNELSGSPITIEDSGDGSITAVADDGTTTNSIFDGGFSLIANGTLYGRGANQFSNLTGATESPPGTMTSVYTAPNIQVTQTIVYSSGDQLFEVTWDVKSTAISGGVSVVPRLVGDLFYRGDTNGFGVASPFGARFTDTAGFVGVTPLGAEAVKQEGAKATIDSVADSTNNFQNGVDTGSTDAAVGVQWGTTASATLLNPGDTYSVSAQFHFARLLVASPAADFRTQGDTESVTVNAQTPDGEPHQHYGGLRYTITGANPGGGAAPVTDEAGATTISWTGTNAGTDTLTVFDDLDASSTLGANEPQRVLGPFEFAAGPAPPAPGTPPDAPDAMAASLSGQDGLVTGASWVTGPPGTSGFGPADKVWSGTLGGFPTTGSTFGIMTSGDASLANHPQTDTAGAPAGNSDRGANDVSVLKVDLNVPSGASCLAFDFQFLSEEYPSFVGSNFNDAFLAELDANDWTAAGNMITAPHNFAFDATGAPVSVNSSGVAQMSAENAAGTVYGGATHVLQATSPVTPGAHTVYFSIFDASDSALDTAAFIDGLRTGTGACSRGVQPVLDPPVIGKTANAVPEKGTVLVKLPAGTTAKRAKALGLPGGAQHFIPLAQATQVPMGSTFNTKKGTVGLSTAVAPGKTAIQKGHFSQGLFVVNQPKKNPLTTLSMNGGGFGKCGRPVPKGGAPKVTASRKRSRRLFSSVKGSFRTRGRNSSATVRGTQWTMTDTCAGTKTTVKQGTVVVRDFRLKKNRVVKAGKSYFAKAPKKKGKRRFGR